MEPKQTQLLLFDPPLNSSQKDSRIPKGILKPRNSLQKNANNRRISWGVIHQLNFLKNEELLSDRESFIERKSIGDYGLSSSPFVLRQDESMFEAIADHHEIDLNKDDQNEEPKPSDESHFNDSVAVDPRKAFDELFLQISMEETNKKEPESLKESSNETKPDVVGKINEPPNNEMSFNVNNLSPENTHENENEGTAALSVIQEQESKFTAEEDSNSIKQPAWNENDDEKEVKSTSNNQEEPLEHSFTLENILTDQKAKASVVPVVQPYEIASFPVLPENKTTFQRRSSGVPRRRLSDAFKTINISTELPPEEQNDHEKAIPFIERIIINGMGTLAFENKDNCFTELVQENIEKIASAKKYKKIDGDFESIYKSTDFRNSTEIIPFSDKKQPENNSDIRNISPGTLNYIERKTSQVDEILDTPQGNLSQMSLSPGFLLEEPQFDAKEGKPVEDVVQSLKFEDEKAQPQIKDYRRRVTEFGLRNILSVIQENSSEKNEESSVVKSTEEGNPVMGNSDGKGFEATKISSENKENINNNENCKFSLSIVPKNAKQVNFSPENSGSPASESSQGKKKYKKTPILYKFKKRSYPEMESTSMASEDAKKFEIHIGKRIKDSNFENAKSPKKTSFNENFLGCFQTIQESPLTDVQKNKLIEILSSNCKKSYSSNAELMKTLLDSSAPSFDVTEVLTATLKEKNQNGQNISRVLAERKREMARIKAEKERMQSLIAEKKDKIEKIKRNITQLNKRAEKTERLRFSNNNYSTVNFLRLKEIWSKDNGFSSFKINFLIPGIDFVVFSIEMNNKTLVSFSSQLVKKTEIEGKNLFLENAKLIENMIMQRIRTENEHTKFKNCFEVINKIIFHINSLALLLRTIDKLERQYNCPKITFNPESLLIQLLLKYYNFGEKLIRFDMSAFDWFEELKMGFEGEKFPEKLGNVLNTIYNGEITKIGIHKIEKIMEKMMSLKLQVRKL